MCSRGTWQDGDEEAEYLDVGDIAEFVTMASTFNFSFEKTQFPSYFLERFPLECDCLDDEDFLAELCLDGVKDSLTGERREACGAENAKEEKTVVMLFEHVKLPSQVSSLR